jgi:hypothetical protein
MTAWLTGFVHWFNTSDGRTMVTQVILPFVAILVAGLLAGAIARGSVRRLMTQQDRNVMATTVAALIAAGRKAASWNTLTAQAKEHVEHQASEAEVRVRMLPVAGSEVAANWAAHHIATMKRNSANFAFQTDQDLRDFQDGLVAWQFQPRRMKKVFAQDLASWKYEDDLADDELMTKQREWATQQATSTPTESLIHSFGRADN